jgi:hypothetical protein
MKPMRTSARTSPMQCAALTCLREFTPFYPRNFCQKLILKGEIVGKTPS